MKVASPVLIAGVYVALSAATMDAAWSETVLRFNAWLPPTHNVQGGVMKDWAQKVERATNGRVRVEFTASSLGAPPRQFDLAADGVADVVLGVHGYTPARFLLTQIAEMPFLGNNGEAISVAYWRVYERFLAKADEHKGVKLLSVWVHGPGVIANSVRPITRIADVQGLKIRVAGGLMVDIASALDAVPITAPVPQLYELLSRGVADGVLFTAEGVTGFNLQRTVKYVTVVPGGLFNTSFFLAMNPGKWNSLSENDRKAIMQLSGEVFARAAGKSYDDLDREAAARLKAEGIQVVTADDTLIKDLELRLKPVEKKWVDLTKDRGIDGAAALQMLREEVAKLK